MAHINYFGVENFRVFNQAYDFELRPITLLIGTNSSGKSSFIKSILALSDLFKGMEKVESFDFGLLQSPHKLDLGNFDNMLSKNSTAPSISFSLPFSYPHLKEDLVLKLKFKKDDSPFKNFKIESVSISEKGSAKKMIFKSYNEEALKINFKRFSELLHKDYNKLGREYYRNENYFYRHEVIWIDDTSFKETSFFKTKEIKVKRNRDFDSLNVRISGISDQNGVMQPYDDSKQNYYHAAYDYDSFKTLKTYHHREANIDSEKNLSNELLAFNRKEKLSPFPLKYITQELIHPDFTDEKIRNKLSKPIYSFLNAFKEDFLEQLISKDRNLVDSAIELKNLANKLENVLGPHFDDKLFELELKVLNSINWGYTDQFHASLLGTSISEPSMGFMDFEFELQKQLKFNDHELMLFRKLINRFSKNKEDQYPIKYHILAYYFINNGTLLGLKKLRNIYDSVTYIPCVRTTVKRVYQNSNEKTFFEECLEEFLKVKVNEVAVSFLKKQLQKFNIAEDISIEVSDDSAILKVNLIIDGQKVQLADVGYGIGQVLPILLKIAIVISKNIPNYQDRWYYHASIFVIEEPETNLHPALQSKLADMFIECYEKYDMQFIIETHSEYLIRKMQYLIAKKEFKAEDAIIYNFRKFNNDETESNAVKPIKFNKDGSLSENFYPGFFDESDNLAISLFNLNNQN